MASGGSDVDYYGSRSFRSHQSFDHHQPATDAVNANGTVGYSQPYNDQRYNQDYDQGYNRKYDRGYGRVPEVYEQGVEDAMHKTGPFRGQNNRRGQTCRRGQRGQKFTAEGNSASSELGFEGDTFCDNDAERPQFDQGLEQKTRNYVPKGHSGKERNERQDSFRDRRDKMRHDDSSAKRGNTWRQRHGVNDQVDRFYAGDDSHASQNYHLEKNWRKTSVKNSDSKEPADGSKQLNRNESNTDGTEKRISDEHNENCVKEGQSTAPQRYRDRNENERFKGRNFRDGEDYIPRQCDQGQNRSRQNKSRKGSKNVEEVPQRDSVKYGIQPVEDVDRPSRDLHPVPDEHSETGDSQNSLVRADSVASSVEDRRLGAQKKSSNWRDSGHGGKPENWETLDGDLMPRGSHRGKRNRKGALEDKHKGETKNRVDSERAQQDMESREDLRVRGGQAWSNEGDGEKGNIEDSAPRGERKDGRRVANYGNVAKAFTKDSKRQTRGRWDDARYSTNCNWDGNEGWKRPQQGTNRQRVNGNDVQQGWRDPGIGVEQSVEFSNHTGREARERLKDSSTKKSCNREATKAGDMEMGSSKEGEIRSLMISEARQPKRTMRDKEDDFPRTANWQDETQRGRFHSLIHHSHLSLPVVVQHMENEL